MTRTDDQAPAVRDAFSVLANETRLDIIEHLRSADGPASYADIKNALGIRDSGRFNYHLTELTGTFVTKSEGGYELSHSAIAVYQAILSTRPIAAHPTPTFDVDETCPDCNSTFEICYENELVVSQCPTCEAMSFGYGFPAGGFEGRSDAEALRAAVQRMYHHVSLAQQGVCPFCSGLMRASWVFGEGTALPVDVFLSYECTLCGMEMHTGVVGMLSQHSELVSLFDDYGIDLAALMPWEYRTYVPTDGVTVQSDDPMEVTVEVSIGGDAFVVTVDEAMEIDGISPTARSDRSTRD